MVRNYKKKTCRGEGTPQDILEAVRDVRIRGKSIRKAASDSGINYKTLQRYVKKIGVEEVLNNRISVPSCSIGYQPTRLIFSTEEEAELESYLVHAADIYFGLSPSEIRRLAYDVAIANGKVIPKSWREHQKSGEDWFLYFMKRHPRLSIRTPQARTSSLDQHNVNLFFDSLAVLLKRYHFEPRNIWNMDEIGLITVQKPERIVTRKGERQVSSITSAERGSLVTMATSVSASGNFIPPFFTFPRIHMKQHFLNAAGHVSCNGSGSKSEWMQEDDFLKFLKHFHKFAKTAPDSPSLLLLDNHGSHLSIDGLKFAKENGITMLSFPPHCSDHIQPLGRSVFGPLKKFANSICNGWMLNNPGKTMTIYDVPGIVSQVYNFALTPMNIKSGFRCTGIYPFNRNIFPETAFRPVYVTPQDTQDHLAAPCAQEELNSPEDLSSVNGVIQDPVTSTSGLSSPPVSIPDVRSFPQAPERISQAGNIRRRKSCILADTPNNKLLEEKKVKKEARKKKKYQNNKQ